MRVFESIVTEFEDIVCFATERLGAFRLFSDSGMAMSHPYSEEMGRGTLNEAWHRTNRRPPAGPSTSQQEK